MKQEENWHNDNLEARELAVLRNMERIQRAAEEYASEHGSSEFPTSFDKEFKKFLPGEDTENPPSQDKSQAGPSLNPFSGIPEFTYLATESYCASQKLPFLQRIADLNSVRNGKRFPLKRGRIIFYPLEQGKGYAIIGGAADNMVMMDKINEGKILVLSNIE